MTSPHRIVIDLLNLILERFSLTPQIAAAEKPLLLPQPDNPPEWREDSLRIPVLDLSRDDLACRDHQVRGQFLARQERWEDLANELREADQNRRRTPGGMPVADLLAYGARADVVSAFEHAIAEDTHGSEATLLDGIKSLEIVRSEVPNNPYITLIVALAHVDIGWSWRGTGWDCVVPKMNRQCCAAHFERASRLLEPYHGIEMNSPAMAAAQCALAAGRQRADLRIADDYEDLIDLDPHNHRHMRALGNHMLPRWFGSYEQLELEARRTASRTQDIWGAGGYTWVCFDAIATDDRACELIDVEFFVEGLRDIIEARPEQEMVNLLAAYCAVAIRNGLGLNEEADLPRMEIADCARWLIRDHLTELHPLIWAHAAEGFDNNTRVTSPTRFAARGRSDALRLIAEQFRDELAAGLDVSITPEGPQFISH